MERGERFKRAIQAKASARGYGSDAALAEAAGITTNTLRNWWSGRGLELGSLANVADVLDESIYDVLYLWQGREPPTPETTAAQAVLALVAELRRWRTAERNRLSQLEATVQELVARDLGERGSGVAAKHRVPRATAE